MIHRHILYSSFHNFARLPAEDHNTENAKKICSPLNIHHHAIQQDDHQRRNQDDDDHQDNDDGGREDSSILAGTSRTETNKKSGTIFTHLNHLVVEIIVFLVLATSLTVR